MINLASIETFAAVEPTDHDWLWTGYVLGGDLSVWVADGGVGKGLVAADLAARISRGWPMAPELPHDPESDPATWPAPGYTIMISLEDKPDTDTVHRLTAAGADLRYIINLRTVEVSNASGGSTRAKFSLPRDIGYLGEVIDYHNDPANPGVLPGGVRLVIIDPLMSAATVSVAGNQGARQNVMDPLGELAERTGAAILIVHHFHKGSGSKNAGRNPVDYMGGSKGISDAARVNVVLVRDEVNPQVVRMLSAKSNVGSGDPVAFMVAVDGHDTRVLWAQPRNAGNDRARVERKVLAVLASSEAPLTTQQVAAIAKLSHALVRGVIARQQRAGSVAKTRNTYALRELTAGATGATA
jgi:hypothetical protein